MPMAASMHVIVSWLHVEMTTMTDGLWPVVIKMGCVVENRRTVTVTWTIGSVALPQIGAGGRTVSLAVTDMSDTLPQSVSALSLGVATEGKRDGNSEDKSRQQHFHFQHGLTPFE